MGRKVDVKANVNVATGISVSARATVSATLRIRRNMAVQFLSGSAYFCRRIAEIEKENAGKPFSNFFDEIIWNFSACIMLSVAALEAYINECADDISFDKELLELVGRRPAILDRYYYFLKLNNKPLFNKGQRPAQDISGLITLRNKLVHFVPVWDDQIHRQQMENLVPNLQTSPFLGEKEPFFPLRCISHSYAEWGIKVVCDFLEMFSDLAGLKFKLAKQSHKFRTV